MAGKAPAHTRAPDARGTPWGDYTTSIEAVEAATGYDFLSNVPLTMQTAIESRIAKAPDRETDLMRSDLPPRRRLSSSCSVLGAAQSVKSADKSPG